MICEFARNLSEDDVRRIRSLEHALGLTILAFSCRSLPPEREKRLQKVAEELGIAPHVEPATADDEQLQRIREEEDALGLSLVAVRE